MIRERSVVCAGYTRDLFFAPSLASTFLHVHVGNKLRCQHDGQQLGLPSIMKNNVALTHEGLLCQEEQCCQRQSHRKFPSLLRGWLVAMFGIES